MRNFAFATGEAAEGGMDSIREALREAIVERRLAPGTKLSEVDVGKFFNVSRTLVRGALQSLSYEGLVRVERNRGAFVAHPSPQEAHEIFEARRQIEPGIAAAAAKNITPADLLRVRQLLAEEQSLIAQRGRDARRAEIKASGDFHLLIAAIAGNSVMERFMKELIARSSLVIALYGQSATSSCGHHEHEEIAAALATGDVQAVSRLIVAHIDHIEADLDVRSRKPMDLREALDL
ncbi:MAG: GntR family transcriptional regulator [Shinella sp.]|nr:GntR family transcriptional regulator [Shinella sp.]